MTKANQVNLSTTNIVNSGTVDFTNPNVKLSGLAAGATSNILYYGAGGLLTTGAVPGGGGGGFTSIVQRVFTPGSTIFLPTVGMKWCIVEALAGGGGGGGADGSGLFLGFASIGGGAGAGGYARGIFDAAQIGASQAIIVGSGGNGGPQGANGFAGGNTSFGGSFITCFGGAGGGYGDISNEQQNAVVYVVGGIGGGSSGTNISFSSDGEAGDWNQLFLNNAIGHYAVGKSNGGRSFLGRGGRHYNVRQYPSPALLQVPGVGGGGAGGINLDVGGAAGQSGGAGVIIITEYI
jgi:hypothetical protein